MKQFWMVISLFALSIIPVYATTPTGQLNASPQTASRWKEYAKDKTGIWFYDWQSVKPEVQDLLTSPTGKIPVVIHAWTKVQFQNGTYSDPQQAYLDCRFKESLAPDSQQEKLFENLCLHPATLQAVNQAIEIKKAELTGNITSDLQRQRMQQEQNAAQQRQYQTQQATSMVQNALWQTGNLINSFRR